MLVLATFIFGWIALSELSVDLLPDVDNPNLLVQTDWTGASASEVETRINEQLEAILSTVPGIKGIHSFARQGQSIIALQFQWGENMDLAFLNTREKLERARFFLPETAGRPQLIYSTPSDEPVAVLSVTLAGISEPDFITQLNLRRWTEQVLTRRLEQIDGVAQAVMVGAVEPEVHIQFDPVLADRFNISTADIQQAIQTANLLSASGELRDGWYRYALNIQSRIQSLEDIKNLPVKRTEGQRVIRMSDIATVQMDERDPTSFSLLDGRTVLTVLVKKDYGTNTVNVFEKILPVLESVNESFQGIEVTILSENATFISNTIRNLLQTLLAGAILAFLVLFVFLSDPRLPFTVCIAIPVSVFLTFFIMYLSGIQLNIVSLSGLTLGIGLLVDNAIVVLENIKRYRSKGLSAFDSAQQGTREIALAITASTFTTISVFLPLVLMGGFEGAFFRDQAFTLSISLLASLLVALTVLPVMVLKFTGNSQNKTDETKFTRGFDSILNLYEKLLGRILKRPVLSIFFTILLAGISVFGFLQVDKSLLPDTEERRVSYQISLPGNAAIFTGRLAASELTRHIQNATGLQGILVMGGYTDQTNFARIANEGLNKFYIEVPVQDQSMADSVHAIIQDFVQEQRNWTAVNIPEFTIFSSLLGTGEEAVVFKFVGVDRQVTEDASHQLQAMSGFELVEFQKLYPELVDIYHIRFNPHRLVQMGITEQEVIRFMESRARGNLLTEWVRGDENIGLRLFSTRDRTFNPQEIRIPSRGRSIPISEIAEITRAQEPQQLERVNQTPVLSFTTGLTMADWWWNSRKIKSTVHIFLRETGVEVMISGSAVQVESMIRDMLRLLLISMLLIYIILAVQYENLKYPFIIIFSVPFAWIGSFIILWITGAGLNMLSFMGILILTGIAVNDAILKVDFMRRYYEETGILLEAIIEAGKHRFRPVIMTTTTTILGLIPMILPFGDGYEFRQSLALALMGGMVTSTLLTLFVIPILFKTLNRNDAKKDLNPE